MAISSHEKTSQDGRPVRPVDESMTPPPALRPGIEQIREIVERAWSLVQRQRRGFLSVFAAVATLLLLAIAIQTPLYESSSLLLVKFGRELVYQPEVGAEQTVVPRDKESVINSELAIARSRPVLEAALRELGIAAVFPDLGEALAELRSAEGADAESDTASLAADPSEASAAEALIYAEAVDRLQGSVTAQALPEADVLHLAYAHPDPLVAMKYVNALVDSFLDAHLTAFGEPRVVAFLEERVKEYQERLDVSETAVLEFETEHAAFALDNPQSALVEWRTAAQTQLTEIDSQMAAIRLRHLQEDTSVAEARAKMLQLQMEASQLDGALLKESEEQLGIVRRFIGQRKYEMGGELAVLEKKKEAVQEELDRTVQELSEMPTLSARYRALVRKRDADEEQYRTYAKRLGDARMSSEMDREKIASINVIEPATPSARPTWPPSMALSIPVAVVLALLAGSLAAIVLDRFGPSGIAWLDGGVRGR